MAGISEPFWRASQRPQFRFRNEAFIPFHSTYPFHLTDVMDAVSPQSNIIRTGLVSPVRSNNIRGVREYEEEIRELRTKNFDLQFRFCMLEELMNKQYKSCTGSDEEAECNVADVLIQLKLEGKDLKNEVDSKDNQLVEALNQNKSYESHIKKLEKQLVLQSETISAYADYPPLEEVEELKLSNEYVIEQLAEKEKSLNEYLNQIEALTKENQKLDLKVKKCYLTIEGFVKKLKENTLPDKVNAAVESALLADTEEEFDTALGSIKSCLQQIRLDTTSTLKENGTGTSIKQDSTEKTSMSSTRSSSSDSFMSSGQSKSKSNYDSTSKSADSLPISSHKLKTSSEIQSLLDENESQANIIRDQNITISNLECRLIQLQSEVFHLHTSRSKSKDEKSMVSSSLNDASSQTTGQSPFSVEDSGNVSTLKEELLRQMLIAEEKEKEIYELQQQLQNIPSKDDTQSFPENEFYSAEKSELQQRLAASISTNKKLIGMLKNLEDFLESLLLNKDLDSSSFENTGLFSHISSLLDQSLRLSTALSDNLTVCESSRIFDIADATIPKNKDLASDSSQTINETSLFPDNQFSHTSEQDTSRSSYVCKKCMEHQLSDVQDRTRHNSKSQAVDDQMITESKEIQSNLIDSLNADKTELSSCISQLKKELSELRDQKDNLETQLSLEKDANSRLRTTIYDLEKKLSKYDDTCIQLRDELNETYSRLTNLDEKCSEYESRISLNAEKHSDELKSVDRERRELMKEINVLISEKQNLLDSIRTEKDICKKLQLELKDKGNIIESLSSSNKELQEAQMAMHKEKQVMQSDLGSLSDALSDQQSKQKEHLQKVEILRSKCDDYENEIESFAEFKSKTTEKLTQVRNDAIENLKSLTNLLKEYFNSEVNRSVDNGDSNPNAFAAMTRDKQIETLLGAISSLNFDLEETITSVYTQIPSHMIWTERKKSELEKEICSLKEEIETKEKEGDIIRTDNESSKSAYEKLLQEMHECKAKLVDLEEEKSRNSELERLRVKNLQNQLEELQNNLKKEISLKNSHESNYQNLLNRYNQSEETISHLQRALVENESLNDEYSAKVDFLQRQLNLKENEVMSAKKHIVDLKECIEKLQKIAIGNKEENNFQLKNTSPNESNSLNSFEKSREDSTDCVTERSSFNPKTTLQLDQFEELQNKLKSAKECENRLQSQTDVLQKTIQEKDKLLEHSNFTENSLRQRLNSLVGEVEVNRKLFNCKDEEITQLQEKLFNVQTEHNNLLTLMSSQNLFKSAFTQTDFERQKDILPDVPSTPDKDSDSPNSRYVKKLTALQLKLSIAEKRADILTKEKSELRDELMAHVRAKTPLEAVEFQKQILSLHEQLEAKNSFIKDLKSQLLKEYASNIEKQKEVEELAKHNSQNNSPSRAQTNMTTRFAEPKLEDNIRALTKQKWQIFHDILQQQKTFYERKNIHLGHFEKYLKFIEQLRSKQAVTNTLDENNHSYTEQILKNSEIELELDTACLQNLNIFLKRFFIPIVLKNCKCLQSDRPDGESPTEAAPTNAILPFNMKTEQKSFASERPTSLSLEQTTKNVSSSDRLVSAASIISRKLDKFERLLGVLNKDLQHFIDDDSCREETAKKSGAKKLLLKLQNDVHGLTSQIFQLNSILKLDGHKTQNLSDQESLMSEDTNLSHSGSLSPASNEDPFSFRDPKEVISKRIPSLESIFQRSHFSSPDLGIESDANHESSAPEEKGYRTKYNVSHGGQESTSRSRVLHAIGELKQFELLKKEVRESLVGIKGVISRTVTGLQHCTKYSSPRKTIEYTTFKAIRDASEDIETCLQAGCKIMDGFQVSTCPSEEDIHALRLQNEKLIEKLKNLQEAKKRQDIEYQKAMERLKEDEAQREEREKKISKKLVKTKKVLRVMNQWMTEFEAQPRHPPIPRYTDDDRPKESE